MSAPTKIVLAYYGGLDTSVILPWLKGRYPGVKLVAFAAEPRSILRRTLNYKRSLYKTFRRGAPSGLKVRHLSHW